MLSILLDVRIPVPAAQVVNLVDYGLIGQAVVHDFTSHVSPGIVGDDLDVMLCQEPSGHGDVFPSDVRT